MPHTNLGADLSIEQQHSAILDCGHQLIDALRPPLDTGKMSMLRARLAALLHANLVAEEAELSGPIRQMSFSTRPAGFSEMANDAAKLRAEYTAHVGRWTMDAIALDRRGYEIDAKELVRATTAHVDKKRQLIAAWRRAINAHQAGMKGTDL